MGFDWTSFATGFLEKTAEIQEQRREEAKDFEEEQRQAAERNIQRLSQRRAFADQVVGYSNYLRTQGFTDAQIQAVVSAGPRKIEEIAATVSQAVTANNGRPLTASEVETLFSMPEGFVPVDMELQEFIDRTYGLGAPTTTQTREQESFNIFDRMFGRDQMSRAEQRLNRTAVFDDMTIQQVNEAARRTDYESLMPGTFVTFAMPRTYSVEDQVVVINTIDSVLDDLQDNREFNAILTDPDLDMTPDERQAAQLQMKVNQVDPIIRGYAEQNPEAFMDAHEQQLRTRLGDAYVDQLREDLGLDVPEPDEEGGDATQQPPQREILQPAVAAPEGTESVADVPTQIPVAPPADETDVDEQQTPPDREPPSDATVTRDNGESYTYQQWQNMTRQEREDAGLPVSFIGGQLYFNRFAVGMGIADAETGEMFPDTTTVQPTEEPVVEGLGGSRRAARNRTGVSAGTDQASAGSSDRLVNRRSEGAASALMENYNVNRGDIQLLEDRGLDMIRSVEGKGINADASDEEIEEAVQAWAEENGVTLPSDMTFVVSSLRSGMLYLQQQQ